MIREWLKWLKANHAGYKNITIDKEMVNNLPSNGIPESLLRSVFESTNIDLANAEIAQT